MWKISKCKEMNKQIQNGNIKLIIYFIQQITTFKIKIKQIV